MSAFLKLLGVDVRPYAKKIEGFDYLPWSLALSLAGRPAHETVVFDTPAGHSAARVLFGGSATAVDMDIGNGTMQRIYLPLLDLRNQPIPAGNESGRDVSDTQGRCAARATAIVHGLGLSLYSLTHGDGKAYVDALAVTPATKDLGRVDELRDIKEIKKGGRVTRTQDYLGWHAAVSAARITDPDFHWEIVECDVVDRETGQVESMPAMKLAGSGWMVGVTTHWKETSHTQWLPIMGIAPVQTKNGEKMMEHQAIASPTVFQWHSAVMRCLAKGIAIHTGYGIACYAGEHGAVGLVDTTTDVIEATKVAKAAPKATGPQGDATDNVKSAPVAELTASIRTLLDKSSSDEVRFLAWLGVPSLDKAAPAVLERGLTALQQKVSGKPVSVH